MEFICKADYIIGRACYDAYKSSCGGLTWDKKEMMEYDKIPEDKQINFINAGYGAISVHGIRGVKKKVKFSD
jgi:hypothetical protein